MSFVTVAIAVLVSMPAAPDCAAPAARYLSRPVHANRAAVLEHCTLDEVLAVLHAAPPWTRTGALPDGDVVQMDEGCYLVDLPEGYTPDRSWPLILSMQGNPPGHSLRVHRQYWRHDPRPAGFILVSPDLEWGKWRTPKGRRRLLDALRDAVRRFHVDPAQIHLAGYSSGGMGAWYFGTWLADLWATVNVRCGLRTSKMGPMENLARVGVYLIHAAADHRCAPSNAKAAAQDLAARGYDHEFKLFPGDHDFQWDDNDNVLEWMRRRRLRDYPVLAYTLAMQPEGRLVRWLYVAGDGRMTVRATARDNRIEVTTSGKGTLAGLAVYLNEEIVDPGKPLVILHNDVERYRGPVVPSLEAFLDAWALFPAYTPTLGKRVFTARVVLEH
jgi:hypothetical protein